MSDLIGVAGLLGLAAVYVGLGLADRGREACGGCALRDTDVDCRACAPDPEADREIAGPEPGPGPAGGACAPCKTDADEWKAGRESRRSEGGWRR